MGAYGYVMASNYNSRPRGAEVLVDGDRYAVATARETYEDLVHLEQDDPEWRDGLMRVGLMADSHDRIPAVAEFVRLMQAAGVSMLLHAGDYCAPFALRPIEEASMSLAGVFGRNDGDTQGLLAKATAGFGAELFEGPHSFELGGQRILVVHDIGDVQPRSIEAHSIVVHGFTHQQEMKYARRHADRESRRGVRLAVRHARRPPSSTSTTKKVEFLSLDPAHWTT